MNNLQTLWQKTGQAAMLPYLRRWAQATIKMVSANVKTTMPQNLQLPNGSARQSSFTGGVILEPSCGEGHISEVLKAHGYNVVSRDLIDRGYGDVADFLSIDNLEWNGDIVTNPPYRFALEFVEKALQIIPKGRKVAMFLKLTFLEGKGRRHLFRTQPPCRVWVSSSRLKCAANGDFDAMAGSAQAYAWFIWEKGYKGETILKWFN